MAKQHELVGFAEEALQQLADDAKHVASQMLGDQGGPDGKPVARAQYLDYFRRGWTHPDPEQATQFRAQELARVVPTGPQGLPARNGMDYWDALVAAAFPEGWEPPLPPSPLDAGPQETPAPPPAQPPPASPTGPV